MASAAQLREAQRTTKRTRVLMIGTLFTPDGAHRVRIRDISCTGAQVVTESAVPHGCDAIFKRGTIFAAARVAWSDRHQVGLTFYRQLSPADVQSTFNAGEIAMTR